MSTPSAKPTAQRRRWQPVRAGLVDLFLTPCRSAEPHRAVRVGVEGEMPVVAEVTPAAVRELDLAEGGEVWVSVKATEITVYPA